MKNKIFLMILPILFSSCNPSKKENTSSSSSNSVTEVNKDELLGKWLQPIPGQKGQKQGFQLNKDQSANSLNIHTLQYEKWAVSEDSLFLWNHTEGVKQTSKSIDTLLIKKLTETELIVSSLQGDQEAYNKEK